MGRLCDWMWWGHVSLAVKLLSSSSPSGRVGGSPPITRLRGTAPTHCLDRTHCRQSIIQRASLHSASSFWKQGGWLEELLNRIRSSRTIGSKWKAHEFYQFIACLCLHENGQKCGWVALGLPEPPWCPVPPAEPVEQDGYLVPSSPRPGSTGAGTAARTSRSELEMRGKQSRDIKAGREKPQSSFGTHDLQQGFSEKMALN